MSDTNVVQKLFSNVSFSPGYGDTGRRIEIVDRECPTCGFDRSYRTTWVDPELGDDSELSCMNPACINHHIPAAARSR